MILDLTLKLADVLLLQRERRSNCCYPTICEDPNSPEEEEVPLFAFPPTGKSSVMAGLACVFCQGGEVFQSLSAMQSLNAKQTR